VSAVDSNVVWIGGDSLTVLRTTNGGSNWSVMKGIQGLSRAIFPIYNISAIDADNAICTGSSNTNTYVFKTTNGGVNWTTVFNQLNGFIDNIYMYSSTTGLICGDPVAGRFSIWKTTDGGNNWDSAGLYLPSMGSEYGVINCLFIDGIKIWMGIGGSYKIYYSSNSGYNWSTIYTLSAVNCIWSNNTASGYFMMGGDRLYSTTNFGNNWSQVPGAPGTGWLCGLTGTGNEWWYTRFGLYVYYSSNNGANWITQYTVSNNNYSGFAKSRIGKYIWGIRDGGKISRYGMISGISSISQTIPSEYKLYQNYPNPFNPNTKIKFDIKEKTLVTIKIFNTNGKEISTLVNDELNAGSYAADFNATSLSSGIYFYILKSGKFTETKKMILIK
jgi:photosystem II stability/assembly factor-like uncharacterized protein